MKTTIFNLFFAGVLSGLVFTSCSKSEIAEMSQTSNGASNTANTTNAASAGKPAPTTAAILNQDLKISYARDNGVDITTQFKDFTFRFNGTYPSGQAHVWNDLLAQTGSWKSPLEAADFTIWYPTDIFDQLAFLNKDWTIIEGGASSFRLTSADGDEVDFVSAK